MGFVEKDYFSLQEIEIRWNLPHEDIAYLAENGLLKISVRVFRVHLEEGIQEQTEDGRWATGLVGREWHSGLLDLQAWDAFVLFRDGVVQIRHVAAEPGQYLSILEPHGGIEARQADIVVRRRERDRVEAQHGLGPEQAPPSEAVVVHNNDYAEVLFNGRTFRFGQCQARIVRILHEAAKTESPWCHGKAVLGQAGSSGTRMVDLFKHKKGWRDLILSDGRGKYRLNTALSRKPRKP
jgi:hypothetical protein